MGISKVYKLTTQDGYTRKGHYNKLKWGRRVTHTATGTGGLCTSGVIHGYTSPLLAVLLNPIHAAISDPKLWEAEMEITHTDGGLKVGGRTMTTIAEIPLPRITNRQRVAFANLCARAALEAADYAAARAADYAARAAARADCADYFAHAAECANYAAHAACHAAHAARAAPLDFDRLAALAMMAHEGE